jgi:pimeloyl-ACP methyl ester carboxylesterase
MAPNGYEERRVRSSDGTEIAYLTLGKGRPLVVVHGGFTVADEWLPVAGLLSKTRQVAVIERRGRGRSGDARTHSLQAELGDLQAVVSDLGGDLDLFGHSSGGTFSILHALQTGFGHALVIYEAPAAFGEPVGGPKLKPIREQLAGGDADKALHLMYTTVVGAPVQEIEAFSKSPLWAHHRQLLPTFIREVEALDGVAPTLEDCSKLKSRTTFLLGSVTQPTIRGYAGGWLARIAGMTVLPIMGQGHICHLMNPPLMAERIQTALSA